MMYAPLIFQNLACTGDQIQFKLNVETSESVASYESFSSLWIVQTMFMNIDWMLNTASANLTQLKLNKLFQFSYQ